ncbi:MAG: GNAT family N-acetyltransferase [Chloroflexota bacterium]
MLTLRQATIDDVPAIRELLDRAGRVMLRFRNQELTTHVERQPFLLAQQGGRLRGFLACPLLRPPRALLAAAGLADDWTIESWLDVLLPPCEARLRALGATSISYTGAADWLIDPLQARGFSRVSEIVAYEKTGCASPISGNQQVGVRPVRPTDFPILAAIDRLVFHPTWHNSAATLFGWQRRLPFFVVALAQDETPVGYCFVTVEGHHGHLIRIAVHPAWQGQGIGARLMAEAMAFFAGAGVQIVTLNTQEENERSQRLYRKFGFRWMGRDAVALWKELSG